MKRETSKPTGKPPWPITLIAGAEKTGKSYGAAIAAASDLIGGTFWINIGEDRPDEYGLLADFEIVSHEGTYRDILAAITDVAAEPPVTPGKPNLLVVDSMTRMWGLITDNAQATANARAIANAKRYNKTVPQGDVSISMDLWNVAKSHWGHIMDAIRAHQGPAILTARLESVTVMDNEGKPTKEKQLKVQAEKSLPFDVGAVIEMPVRGETYISGVRSVRLALPERTRVPEFTMDMFWRKLGLHDTETGARTHDAPVVEAEKVADEGERDWLADAEAAPTSAEASRIGAAAAVVLGKDHDTVAAIRDVVAAKRGPLAPESTPADAAPELDPAHPDYIAEARA